MSRLRIAFFGSDKFSLHSLTALHVNRIICNIDQLHVITRPIKSSGRGRSICKEAVTAEYAKEQDIPVLRAESAEQISDLQGNADYNMAIAVSYGKLVPAEFLSSLKYGGLNVHPSLLPQFRGSSPLQYALLNHMPFTGVSVQTLHPTKFDHGTVLYQSEPIAVEKAETVDSLRDKLGPIGAEGLMTVLRERRFENFERFAIPAKYPASLAPKITKEDSFLSVQKHTVDQAVTMCRVFGSIYGFQKVYKKKDAHEFELKRLIFRDLKACNSEKFENLVPGEYTFGQDSVIIRLKDGCVQTNALQLENYGVEKIDQFEKSLRKRGIKEKNITGSS